MASNNNISPSPTPNDETLSFLYDVKGKINLKIKYELTNKSLRQVIQSIPPVIVSHLLHQNEDWINAGTLMAEHLTKKFVPRAYKWLNNLHNSTSMDSQFDFDTHICGYSLQPFVNDGQTLHDTAVAHWNEFPYKVEYKFKFNVSSTALENYKWLTYHNYMGQKLRDQRFKTYIQAIVDSQAKGDHLEFIYNVKKAMDAVMFLVE